METLYNKFEDQGKRLVRQNGNSKRYSDDYLASIMLNGVYNSRNIIKVLHSLAIEPSIIADILGQSRNDPVKRQFLRNYLKARISELQIYLNSSNPRGN